MAGKKEPEVRVVQNLFADIAHLITESKASVAQTVNTTLTLLYWKIGKRINEEVLQHKRADYGMQVMLLFFMACHLKSFFCEPQRQ